MAHRNRWFTYMFTYVYLLIAWWLPGFSMANCHNQMVPSPASGVPGAFSVAFQWDLCKMLEHSAGHRDISRLNGCINGFIASLMPFLALFYLIVGGAYCIPILVDLHTPWVFDAVDERTCLIMFDCLTFKIQYCQGVRRTFYSASH